MGIVELITQVVKLAILILGEYFQAKKDAAAKEAAFQLTEATFRALAQSALAKMRTDAATESPGLGDMWDEQDADEKKGTIAPKPPGGQG